MSGDTVRVGSAALVVRDESVLLGRRAKEPNYGRWVMPGGKIEVGETIDEAARREVREETGLTVEITARLGIFEIVAPDEHSVFVLSEARVIGGQVHAASDLNAARFFDRAELLNVDLSAPCRDALRAVGWLNGPDVPTDVRAWLEETYTAEGVRMWLRAFRRSDTGHRERMLRLARTPSGGT